jgi:hypothetical protein
MSKKQLQIKDSQVKKNLGWHILRLLRLNSRTRQELIDELSDMYMGYWRVNNKLLNLNHHLKTPLWVLPSPSNTKTNPRTTYETLHPG